MTSQPQITKTNMQIHKLLILGGGGLYKNALNAMILNYGDNGQKSMQLTLGMIIGPHF